MYHYTECGLDHIWLRNGFEKRETPYGKAVAIHDMEGLHRAIGIDLVRNTAILLSGSAIRFLRKEMDLSQNHLSRILGVSEQSVRGWEKDRSRISGPAERMLRVLYCEHACGDGSVRDLLERLSELNRGEYMENRRLELEETEQGWRNAA